MGKRLSRRFFVKVAGLTSAGAAGAVLAPNVQSPRAKESSEAKEAISRALIPPASAQEALPPAPYRAYEYFTPAEAVFMEAAVDRLIPSDSVGPGALELGAAYYIDQQLMGIYGEGHNIYLQGPFQQGEPTQGYQLPLRPREIYRVGIAEVDNYCRSNFGGNAFAQLNDSQQETVLKGLESGDAALNTIPATLFFGHLLQNTTEGYFCDPIYGGNRDMGSWKMLGFPGARANFIADVGKPQQILYPPVSVAQIVAEPGIQ